MRVKPKKAIHVFSELDDAVLLSLNDTADVLDVHPQALKTWTRRGVGPKPIRIGGSTVRFSVGSIRRYLDERAKAAEAEAAKATEAALSARKIGRPRWREREARRRRLNGIEKPGDGGPCRVFRED